MRCDDGLGAVHSRQQAWFPPSQVSGRWLSVFIHFTVWKPITFLYTLKYWLLFRNRVTPLTQTSRIQDWERILKFFWPKDSSVLCLSRLQKEIFFSFKALCFLGPLSVVFVFESFLLAMVQKWSFPEISEALHVQGQRSSSTWTSDIFWGSVYVLVTFSLLRHDTQHPQLKGAVDLGSHFRSFSLCSASWNTKNSMVEEPGQRKLFTSWQPGSRERKDELRREIHPWGSRPGDPPLPPNSKSACHPKIQSPSRCLPVSAWGLQRAPTAKP